MVDSKNTMLIGNINEYMKRWQKWMNFQVIIIPFEYSCNVSVEH